MEAIWKKQYSLAELVAPEQFKSYEDLKKRLDYVLGVATTPKAPDPETIDEETDFSPNFSKDPVAGKVDMGGAIEEDDALSYFQKLA